MKKMMLAVLAILGIVLGTANLIAPAHAYYQFAAPNENAQTN